MEQKHNKHVGSSLESLLEETGEKEEVSKLAKKKATSTKKSKKKKSKKKKATKKKVAKKTTSKKISSKKSVKKDNTQSNPQIEAQKEVLKSMGVDIENSPKTPQKSNMGRLQRTEDGTKETLADKMWNSIKDQPMELFAIPNKKVSDYVQRVKVVDSLLHLKIQSQAVWPPLEEIIKHRMYVPKMHVYNVEFIAGYLVVSAEFKA